MEKRQETRYGARSCFVECAPARLFSFMRKKEADIFPLVNLSEGGIQFLSHKSMARGKPVALVISIPGEEEPLKMKGKVAWAERLEGREFYRIGVSFTGVSGKQRARLLSMFKEGRLRPLDLSRHSTQTS